MTELLICASFILVPLFLIVPMFGKFIDMKHTAIQAARYEAWEYTVWYAEDCTRSALAAQAYAEKNWPESEKHYATLTRESPGEAEPWFKLGNIYARTFRPELAVKAYRETLVRDPQNIKAWHNLGVIELRQAANTFATLQDLLDPDDALYKKSVNIQTSIDELVN